jgi:hypothetical protein
LNVTIGGMTVVVFHRDSANITTDCVVSWVAREVG